MKSLTELEKKKTKNELIEETRKHKKRVKFLLFILVVLLIYLTWNYIEGMLDKKDFLKEELKCQVQLEEYFYNQTNQSLSQFKSQSCEESSLTRSMNSFFENFLTLEKPWVYKTLIFLGVVYLIQITFVLVMDILEVFMLIVVIIKRIVMWIIRLFKK